jgi:hypothetical protein
MNTNISLKKNIGKLIILIYNKNLREAMMNKLIANKK